MLDRISKVLGVKKRRKEEQIGRGAGARGEGFEKVNVVDRSEEASREAAFYVCLLLVDIIIASTCRML